MTFWRKNWYYIGGILFVLLAFVMGLWGSSRMSQIQVILVFSWMGMLMHQLEEYAYPGGFPIISNMAGLGELEHPERYPLNARQSFLSNVIFCYLSYIIPILFPHLIWMGASSVLAGVWQLPGHGIAMNIRLKSKYNPGLASTALLQTPVAIYYIWYVVHYMPEQAGQLWWGIPGSLVMLFLTFIVPILFMKDRDSKYPFDDRELYGYNKEHVMRLWEERKAAKAAKEER
ncbi:HXXEE domain-containing protein [Lachnospiraceae bacterium ASD3451]|uniref:HXXEE domain-containing protein n=1 Tax=Diplocloster agilis TaxID=2850323 RepID=UPI001D39F5B6|nr:HXXEE domain-containing protein [Diplocloster agilis]MBU9745676.1 HXXEE domain-containing protein [Diplocloster agilis]